MAGIGLLKAVQALSREVQSVRSDRGRRRFFIASWAVVIGFSMLLATAHAYERVTQSYTLPTLPLQRADGQAMPLSKALADGRPVVLTFMFSSCNTVCPITNQTLVELGRLLGTQRDKVSLVSISIDPDHDSVKQMAAYAQRNGHQGMYFTGDPASTEAVQRAFDAWRGNKMHHEPAFFLNHAPSTNSRWVRLAGVVTARELLHELRQLAPGLGIKP